MSLKTNFAMPTPETSMAAPVLKSISWQRATGQGLMRQVCLARIETVRLGVFTVLQAALHTFCVAARIAFSASQVVLYPVLRNPTPRAELKLAIGHAGVAIKSGLAAALITAPAVLMPDLAVRTYKWLGLYSDAPDLVQRIKNFATLAWESPHRDQVLMGTAAAVATVIGLRFALGRPVAAPIVPLKSPPIVPSIPTRETAAPFIPIVTEESPIPTTDPAAPGDFVAEPQSPPVASDENPSPTSPSIEPAEVNLSISELGSKIVNELGVALYPVIGGLTMIAVLGIRRLISKRSISKPAEKSGKERMADRWQKTVEAGKKAVEPLPASAATQPRKKPGAPVSTKYSAARERKGRARLQQEKGGKDTPAEMPEGNWQLPEALGSRIPAKLLYDSTKSDLHS